MFSDRGVLAVEYLYPIVASALTNIHPGAGRSPGVVDLPVTRDALGFPYIPGSGLKGSLKTTLALKKNCVKNGTVLCKNGGNNCSVLCCLLGGDVGDTDASSSISLGDLYPLLVPVPSLSHGFLYATSPALIARAEAISSATTNGDAEGVLRKLVEWLRKGAEKLEENVDAVLLGGGGEANISIGLTSLTAQRVAESLPEDVAKKLDELNPVYSHHGLNGNTVVVQDSSMLLLIERSLVRLTRVRLNRKTKTVSHGALWTEEYIPQFTLFAGYVADTGIRGKYCNDSKPGENMVEKLVNLLGGEKFSLVIGGKETVGKGLLSLLIDKA